MSFWSSPIWTSVLTPGLVAAGVTLLLYAWIQRPRADLRMTNFSMTVDDADRLSRAYTDGDWTQFERHWAPKNFVRLTNYGDGTAYDIKLSGRECRPRVWVDDMGAIEGSDKSVSKVWPMWSNNLSALEPGKSVTIFVMSSPDPSRPKPVVLVSWPRLPRRGLGRKTIRYDSADKRPVENGWPGKSEV